jgi:hypothetical protein
LRTLSIIRNSKLLENTSFQKLDLFPISGEGRETLTLLGPLGIANLNQGYWLALFKGPNRVDVFLSSLEDKNFSLFTIWK